MACGAEVGKVRNTARDTARVARSGAIDRAVIIPCERPHIRIICCASAPERAEQSADKACAGDCNTVDVIGHAVGICCADFGNTCRCVGDITRSLNSAEYTSDIASARDIRKVGQVAACHCAVDKIAHNAAGITAAVDGGIIDKVGAESTRAGVSRIACRAHIADKAAGITAAVDRSGNVGNVGERS